LMVSFRYKHHGDRISGSLGALVRWAITYNMVDSDCLVTASNSNFFHTGISKFMGHGLLIRV
jgi:hypothetical protein